MDRAAIFLLIFVSVCVGASFVASLVFARPWTRWVSTGLVLGLLLFTKSAHPLQILSALPIVIVIGALGFGVATFGIRLRRGRPEPRHRVTP